MSTSQAAEPLRDRPQRTLPASASVVPSWLRFFRSELQLVFRRPRNVALLGVLAVIPAAIGVLFKITVSNSAQAGAPPFFNQVAGNGVFLSLAVLVLMLTLFLPLSICVVAGDAIAGEASHGTLRGLLTVPAGRTRLLWVKYCSIVVFALAACLVVVGVALLVGVILFPVGQVTLLSGTTVSLAAGLLRVLLVALYAGVAMAALGAIALAASTFTVHPVGAIAAALVLVLASEIADAVPQLSAMHPFLPSHFWLTWDGLFRSPVDLSGVQHGLLSFVIYIVIFFAIAWARLTSADITS
jgi:ABC-type transport system involved in multi-copper enzyme maturation permease subunit